MFQVAAARKEKEAQKKVLKKERKTMRTAIKVGIETGRGGGGPGIQYTPMWNW